ncbi:MAG: hypothetical protein HOK65_13135, partial [Crocinitomicaceae bacterium]|nr:hypothetical protein [Crocinitomicaceae bacterium]
KLREMELEGVQLPKTDSLDFGDEGETQDVASGGEGEGDMGGGLFGGDDDAAAGDDAGDAGGLFSGEIKKGRLMSEEELDAYDELIDGSDEDDSPKNIWGGDLPINANSSVKKTNQGKVYTDFKETDPAGGATNYKNIGPPTAKELMKNGLMDGIMPQSPVVSKHIDRQLSYRMSKDLASMGSSLKLGTKSNKLLKEDNEQEYDILIDDNFLNEEDKG